MRALTFQPKGQRGFYLIGLLIVLLIILILTYKEIGPDSKTGISTAKMAIDRSKDVACTLNRQTLNTAIMQWNMTHPGKLPTIEKMEAAGISVPTCPGHGVYSIGEDGTVYCSEHFPRPVPTGGPAAARGPTSAPSFPTPPATPPNE